MKTVALAVPHCALGMALAAGLQAIPAQAGSTTLIYQLGASGNGTFFAGGAFKTWLGKGALPVGSILRAVTADATLDSSDCGNWANDLMVMIDPTPQTPGGDSMLAIGNGDITGSDVALTWANGFNVAGTPLHDTKTAPVNFPASMDLHGAAVLLGNTYGGPLTGGTWSGTLTLTYDCPDGGFIRTFGLAGYPAVISGTDITWSLPLGTTLTTLAPTYTLSSGTCNKASGSTHNFSAPQTYTVTDGSVVNVYTVNVVLVPPVELIQVHLDTAARSDLTGPAGSPGAIWNQAVGIPPLAATGLLDASGTPTGVGFSCNADSVNSWGGPALTLLTGGVFPLSWNTPAQLVLTGLTPGKHYTLYLPSFYPDELGGKTLFSTANATTTTDPQIVDNGGPNGNSSTWVRGVNFARCDDLIPDSNNRIVVNMVSDSGTNDKRAYLCGFQLVSDGPLAPLDLAATPTKSQVALTWSAWPGATGYRVQRSLTSGGPYTTLTTVTAAAYTDHAVANGTTYFYVVSATQPLGESANSTEISATPAASPAKDILTFGPAAVIAGTDIFWTIPLGTALTSLAPTFTLSPFATCAPASGSSRNFSTHQTYTVTAEDGSSQVYHVTLLMADDVTQADAINKITNFTFPGLGSAAISGNQISLNVPAGTPVTAMAPTFTLSAGATCVPPSGTIRDFTNPQVYVVTAANGVTRMFTVAVQPTVTLDLAGSPLTEAGGTATVTATLSATHAKDVTVILAYWGTATPAIDYTPSATRLVIPAGRTSGSLTLTAVPNAVYEGAGKTIVIQVGAAYNATANPSQVVSAVIAEDEPPPLFPLVAGDRGLVTCLENPSIIYDAYLPTSYSPGTAALPIIYTFNPSGGGMVDDFQQVAASMQLIVIGVRNCRNHLPWDEIYREFHAVARDVRQRLVFDPSAQITAGFSGGGVAAYAFSRFEGQHIAAVLAMGSWLGCTNNIYPPEEWLRSGLLVARTTGNTDSGALGFVVNDGNYLVACGAVVKDYSFVGGHQSAPDDMKTAALNWILNNRVLGGPNERANALAQATTWQTRIAAGERQAVLAEVAAVLFGQRRNWFVYQAQRILDQLMDEAAFRALDTTALAQGLAARDHFYYAARGAGLNNDEQHYRAAMKALAGVTGADGYRRSDVYALLTAYGYAVPALSIRHADGTLNLTISKDTLGLTYALESSPSLSAGTWQNVSCSPLETTTTWATGLTPSPAATGGFYRVRVTPSASAVP